MTVEEIAAAIGVSKVSIRRHLDLLRKDGLVAFEIKRHDRGRPGHVYYLTSKAEMLFPTGYNTFALNLLKQVSVQFGLPAVTQVLGGQADDLIALLKPQLDGLAFDAKVKKFGHLINERGYDVVIRRLQDGSYLVRQQNCPMVAVATSYNQICHEELRAYQEILDAEVFRDCLISLGARSCDYRILPPLQTQPQPA